MEPINSGSWTGADPWTVKDNPSQQKYEALQRMRAQITAGQQETSNQCAAGSLQSTPPAKLTNQRATQLIQGRLDPIGNAKLDFEFLNAHQSGEEVHVFVIADGKPVVFTDGVGLFPSDQLITQLRLIGK